MTTGRDEGAQGAANPNLWDMLGQIGFPPPQQLLQEVQRFNGHLEKLGPDVHRIAEAAPAITRLAEAAERIDPAQVQRLTQALEEASQMGGQLQQRLWGNG